MGLKLEITQEWNFAKLYLHIVLTSLFFLDDGRLQALEGGHGHVCDVCVQLFGSILVLVTLTLQHNAHLHANMFMDTFQHCLHEMRRVHS